MKRTILVFLAIFSLTTTAHAHSGYHYAGVSRTAKVARYSSAIMTVKALPTQMSVQAIGWTALADLGGSGAYVEAGVGMPYPGGRPNTVSLWWANNNKWSAQTVASVPLGTPVLVEITKKDGESRAIARWTWVTANGVTKTVQKSVSVKGWVVGPGIHPTQAEVYTRSTTDHPRPFVIEFQDVKIYPEDLSTAYLYKDDPYYPVGTLTDFSVTYP